jgi:hypothetical protein
MGLRLQPALLSGVAIGVLSALPVVNVANLCCCAWVVFGGALAAYLLQQNQPTAVTGGDGALVGLMAGAIGAVVGAVLSIPIAMAMGPFQAEMIDSILRGAEDMPPEVRAWFEQWRGGMATGAAAGLGFLFSLFFSLFFFSIFGMFGGILGALLFRRNPPPPPPPPAPVGGYEPPRFSPPPPPPPPEVQG